MDQNYINRLNQLLETVNEKLMNLDQSTAEYKYYRWEDKLLVLKDNLEKQLIDEQSLARQIGVVQFHPIKTKTINSSKIEKTFKTNKKQVSDKEYVLINRIKEPILQQDKLDDSFNEFSEWEEEINTLLSLDQQTKQSGLATNYEFDHSDIDKKTRQFENEKVTDIGIKLSARKKDEGTSNNMPKKKPTKSASAKPKKKPIKKPKTSKKSKQSKAAELLGDSGATNHTEQTSNNFMDLNLPEIEDTGVRALKQIQKRQKQLTSKYSKDILNGAIVTTTHYHPDLDKHVIELRDVTKSYLTGDVETQVLKGIDIKLNKSDFIVILGPSGSGKTTFLNTISGLDKATKGDVFVLGYNLSLLKDSHLTKFRRKHVGFIFQQYNLLTNLTAKENAEVGENLSTKKHPEMSIEDIFETIGMKEQMNKYPHQMSGGQQQRVSIARALAKNPDILFADEPTGALDEEMGRKVLQILVDVNKLYKTTVIVVTHNPNIAKIGNTIIHIKNGLIDDLEHNAHPADPEDIDWS